MVCNTNFIKIRVGEVCFVDFTCNDPMPNITKAKDKCQHNCGETLRNFYFYANLFPPRTQKNNIFKFAIPHGMNTDFARTFTVGQ
jgi:hypothetical protein